MHENTQKHVHSHLPIHMFTPRLGRSMWSRRQPLFAEGRSPRHAPELTVSESEPIDRVGKAQVSCAQVANSCFEES